MYEIIAIRTEPSEDLSHEHIELVGYHSPHIDTGEAITIPPARVIQRIAFGEQFGVRSGDGVVEVKAGTCSVCGHGPYLEPQDALFALPRK